MKKIHGILALLYLLVLSVFIHDRFGNIEIVLLFSIPLFIMIFTHFLLSCSRGVVSRLVEKISIGVSVPSLLLIGSIVAISSSGDWYLGYFLLMILVIIGPIGIVLNIISTIKKRESFRWVWPKVFFVVSRGILIGGVVYLIVRFLV